jgi:anti-sigma-K factor RskA
MPDESHVLDLLPAYALGSLDTEEALQVEEHLTNCKICQRELRQLQTVAEQLNLAVPPVDPAPAVKKLLMQRIHDAQAPGLARERNLGDGHPWMGRLLPFWGLAGLALMVILAVFVFGLWQRTNRLEVATAPGGMRAVPLSATGDMPGATGFVLIGADGMNGALVVDGLPPLDESQQYQLWLILDEKSISGAIFSTDEQKYGGTRIRVTGSLLEYHAVMVTIEPAGGSSQPTGTAVLQGSLFNP